jgi:capsular exopolysaccharide synthesis family protein
MSDQAPIDPAIQLEPARLNQIERRDNPPDGESAGRLGLGSVRSYDTASNVLGNTDVHLLDYVKILYKRRRLALTALVIIFLSSAIYTFTQTPIYQAKTEILIEKENSNVVTFKEVLEQNQIADDYYQTQYKILQSRALAKRTIDALQLWDDPQFNPPPTNSLSLSKIVAMPISLVASWIKGPREHEAPLPDETKVQSAKIDRFLGSLDVAPVKNSRLVDVTYTSEHPELAARVANALAKAYIDQNLEFKFLSTKEATDWLAQRLAEQRKQVEASEQAVQRYREQTDSVSLEDKQNIVMQKLSELNAAVTRAKTLRIEKEAAYNQIRSLQSDRVALDTFPAILSNSFIQQQRSSLAELQRQQVQLSEKLGPNHPDMVKLRVAIESAEAKIQGEISNVVRAMGNDYQQAVAQEQSLMKALEQQKNEALQLNRKGIEYGVLARDAASNRQIFDSLMQRTKETGISGELKTSNIRVVDAAETPRAPISPRTRLNLLIGLFGGATVAVGLAFFFEYVDNRIKSPDELRQHLGLAFLGMVPAVFDKKAVNPLINNGVPTNFLESFRAIRTNVLFSTPESGSRCIVVTSTGPGEGKTLVASNLALALAQAGQRVLLIDADMRKPRVHEVFDRPQEPGLSNVLVGNAKASEAVHTAGAPGLWVMPAGVNPPNPAELLGSKRFKDFVGSLVHHFDWVMIDTPPVMAVTDASVVAHLAHGVLFIVGAEMTSRHASQRALDQLEQARAKFLGAVLNRVDLQHNGYYYSQYYRREYNDYYTKATPTA